MKRLMLRRGAAGFVLVAAAMAIFAPVASAHFGTVSISCTQVTFSYTSFPSGSNSANEAVTINGSQVASRTFTFSGSSASDSISISGQSGDNVTGSASWTADGGGQASTSTTLSGCTPPPVCKGAPAGYPNLGGANLFTVFALNGTGGQRPNFSLDTVNGRVGVASGASVTNQAPSKVNGNVYVDSGGLFSGPGHVNGTVFRNQNLAGARSDAINASHNAAALTPDVTYSQVNSSKTVVGHSGLNVVDVNGNVNLNNGSLILSGPSNAWFVVNVSGSISLVGRGGIEVGGSVPTSHLVTNMTGTGSVNTHIGNDIEGTLLAPYGGGSLDGTFGSLLLGQNFSLMSGVLVNYEGCGCQY